MHVNSCNTKSDQPMQAVSGKDEAGFIQKRLLKEPELRQSVLTEEFNEKWVFYQLGRTRSHQWSR